jgi:hypothetical protein
MDNIGKTSPKSNTGFITKFLKRKASKIPLDVPSELAKDLSDPIKQKAAINRMLSRGTVFNRDALARLLSDALATSYYRRTFYRETEQASTHPLVAGALELYVDTVTAVSGVTNRIAWITSEDQKVENTLNQFLDEIGLDEHVKDWAGQLGMFGDFFIEGIGREGVGIAYVDDAIHPADMERIDVNGRLEGFVRTGLYSAIGQQAYTAELEPPWKYVHFRIHGMTKKVLNTALGIFGEPGKMFSLERERMSDRKFRVTTKYGTSLLTPAIPIYKRLKMCEDSLLMSRMTRGIMWYMYKIKVAGGNMDSIADIVQSYAEMMKRSQSSGLNTETDQKEWKDKWAPVFAQTEDMFVPESDDISVTVDKLGGEPDIKAIVDVDMLVNQLLGALRVSKSLLGITDDLPGSIGEGAANRISINFAKNAQRLQTGLRQGIKRLCQIHLAYRNLNPDPTRFEVNFAEISSAEEEEIKNSLESGVDIVQKAVEMIAGAAPEGQIDKLGLLDYFNRKILKLGDLDLEEYTQNMVEGKSRPKIPIIGGKKRAVVLVTDCMSYVPSNKKVELDESMKVLVNTPDDELDENAQQIKNGLMKTKNVKVFRVDETKKTVDVEETTWAPMPIKFTEPNGNNKK